MRGLEAALETDVVLSERQVQKHYGVSLETCETAGLCVQSALIAPTVHRRATREVSFVSLEPLTLEPFEIRHLAGVAEVRHQLRVPRDHWQVVQHASSTSPDAIWTRGLECWAVEFDAGAYSRRVVLEKKRAFEAGFDGQIWAASSNARMVAIQHLLKQSIVAAFPF
jgi:hypothetical protein